MGKEVDVVCPVVKWRGEGSRWVEDGWEKYRGRKLEENLLSWRGLRRRVRRGRRIRCR